MATQVGGGKIVAYETADGWTYNIMTSNAVWFHNLSQLQANELLQLMGFNPHSFTRRAREGKS